MANKKKEVVKNYSYKAVVVCRECGLLVANIAPCKKCGCVKFIREYHLQEIV